MSGSLPNVQKGIRAELPSFPASTKLWQGSLGVSGYSWLYKVLKKDIRSFLDTEPGSWDFTGRDILCFLGNFAESRKTLWNNRILKKMALICPFFTKQTSFHWEALGEYFWKHFLSEWLWSRLWKGWSPESFKPNLLACPHSMAYVWNAQTGNTALKVTLGAMISIVFITWTILLKSFKGCSVLFF